MVNCMTQKQLAFPRELILNLQKDSEKVMIAKENNMKTITDRILE